MKKILVVLLGFIFLLSGCGNNKISYVEHIEESIGKYYTKNRPHNDGTLIIGQIKEFDGGYLVMAEKYSRDGHNFDELFLLDANYEITHTTAGAKPLSPCFSYNKLCYNGKTILFGSFNDTKWVPETDTKVKVDIKEVYVEAENGVSIFEKVDFKNGYLIVMDGEFEIDKFEIYNDNKVLQAELDKTIVINNDNQFVDVER